MLALPAVTILGVTFDAHTLLFASMFLLCGYQSLLFAVFTKTFAVNEGLMPGDERFYRFYRLVNLERGLIAAAVAMLSGVILLCLSIDQWRLADFGHLNYAHTMRLVVPGATLTALGFQTMLSSFFVSLLGGMHRR